MKRIKSVLTENIGAGWLYFYVHFVTEVICFYCLELQTGDSVYLWIFPFIYDALAFVPQAVIGYISDKFPKIQMGIAGIVLMTVAAFSFWLGLLPGKYTALIILCIGNACVHVNGAEATLRCSGGKLAHSAIFVAGGSFGVITGRLLARASVPYWAIIILVITGIPFVMLAEYYRKNADKIKNPCGRFCYASKKLPAGAVIALAVLIVAVRGYMGYGIPTSWNKTVFQSVMLYVAMGVGKAAGGILADRFGVKKTAMISAAAALPFLFLGDNLMSVSLIGVMLFSMTMSITLALLVSVLPNAPGLAFGFTTIGLFLGTAPIFFFKFTTTFSNCVVIAVLTVLCLVAMQIVIRKDGAADENV